MKRPAENNPDFAQVINRLRTHLSRDYPGQEIRIEPISAVSRRFSEMMMAKVITPGSSKNILIKLCKLKENSHEHLMLMRDRLEKDYVVTKNLYDCFKEYPGFSTTNYIACFPDLLALVMEECRAQNLQEILMKEAKLYPRSSTIARLSSYSYRCGQWLRYLQTITKGKDDELFDLNSMVNYVDVRLRRLVANPRISFHNEFRQQILKYFHTQKVCLKNSDLSVCGIHADFCLGNVLVNDEWVIGIDFAMYHQGSVYHDLTHFYQSLENFLMKPVFRPKVISKLQEAFVGGYDEKFDVRQSSLFKLFQIQHVLCHLNWVSALGKCPVHERLFNRWICRRHVEWLIRAISIE